MTDAEKAFEAMESQVPALSAAAVEEAYNKALAAGLSVYVSRGEAIFEVFPNGASRFVKNVEPPTPMPVGTQVQIP